MKKLLVIFLLLHGILHTQVPYTGGNGSGFAAALSATTVCVNFYGGMADGAAANTSALTICPPFFGGTGDGYDGAVTITCLSTLPVKILSFTGQHEATHNTLRWQIDAGYEVKEFIVERSTDRAHFTAIPAVKGSIAPAFHFTVMDASLIEPVYFYRLRIVEHRGDISFSAIIVLRSTEKNSIQVFPNPAEEEVTIFLWSSRTGIETLQLFNTSNQKLVNKKYNVVKGSNYLSLNFSSLSAGIYFIRIGEQAAIKLVKK